MICGGSDKTDYPYRQRKKFADGSLENIRKEYTDTKRLTIDFIGEDIQLVEGMKFILQEKNHEVIDIDSKMLTVSDAISTYLVKLNDISNKYHQLTKW